MSDPTGVALLTRIKELEEALRPFVNAKRNRLVYSLSYRIVIRDDDIKQADKALNK